MEPPIGKRLFCIPLSLSALHPLSASHVLSRPIEPPQTLQFQTVVHKVTTCDCQPSPSDGILVMITGDLAVRTRCVHTRSEKPALRLRERSASRPRMHL